MEDGGAMSLVEGTIIRCSTVPERRVHGYLPPTTAAPPTTLSHRDDHGWNTETKYAFDAPLIALVRFRVPVACLRQMVLQKL